MLDQISKKLDYVSKKLEVYFPFKRKKAIEDWDFIMAFEEYYKQEVEMILQYIKCKEKFEWKLVAYKDQKKTLVLLKFNEDVVIDMAHQLKILKKKDKKSFKLSTKDLNSLIYTMGKGNQNNAYNYLCYIRARMYPENKLIYEQEQYSSFNKKKINQYKKLQNGELFTEEEKLRAKYHFLLTYSEESEIKENQVYAQICRQPFYQLMKHPGFLELVPIQKVSQIRPLILGSLRDYLGPNLDCYFDFVTFFQNWLWFPLVVGLITVGINTYFDYTVDNSPVDFLYAWAVMIWSILFITRWEQIHDWMKVKEQPGTSEIWSEHQEIVSKVGMEKKISKITGRVEYSMSFQQQVLLLTASNAIFLSITVITLVFMVLSLNLRGFIDPQHKLFYSETLSALAAPQGIFDANTWWAQIPNIFHVVVTNGFDEMVYRPLAKKLAKFERHNSKKGYENSIIIKYFIYEFLLTFADLFYIAFVRFDIDGLHEQLLSLFFIDIVRRVVSESLIPWIQKTKRSKELTKNFESQILSSAQQLKKGAIMEVDKPQYEQFDDYLQIITNFGYLVMISSCFPLAPLLILIAHQVQLFQDKYKIVHIFKRKLPQNYVGMGRWKNIIVFMCYASIITNIMLFAFSSEQVSSVFPRLFEGGKDLIYGNTDLTTLFGGAATGLLQTMMDIGNQVDLNMTSAGWGGLMNSTNSSPNTNSSFSLPEVNIMDGATADLTPQVQPPIFDSTKVDMGGLFQPNLENQNKEKSQSSEKQQNAIIEDLFGIKPTNTEASESSFTLQNFKPPSKESEITFIAILFFIQHFFLILFIVLRDYLKKKKSDAQIFTERRDYKRKIKKNLPKNILSIVSAGMLIHKYFEQKDGDSGKNIIGELFKKSSKKIIDTDQGNSSNYQSTEAESQVRQPSLNKKQSELSGDGFLLQEDVEERETRQKEDIRQILLESIHKKSD